MKFQSEDLFLFSFFVPFVFIFSLSVILHLFPFIHPSVYVSLIHSYIHFLWILWQFIHLQWFGTISSITYRNDYYYHFVASWFTKFLPLQYFLRLELFAFFVRCVRNEHLWGWSCPSVCRLSARLTSGTSGRILMKFSRALFKFSTTENTNIADARTYEVGATLATLNIVLLNDI